MSSGGRVCAAGESPRRRVSKARSFYARARRKNVHCRFTDTDQHAHTSPREPRGERSRRSRRRRRRHERSARRPCACRRVAIRPCRTGTRAGGTCEGPRGTRRPGRGRCREAAAAAGVGGPKSLEAAATPSARPAAGARAQDSKRMIWHTSSLGAGSGERARRPRRGERRHAWAPHGTRSEAEGGRARAEDAAARGGALNEVVERARIVLEP